METWTFRSTCDSDDRSDSRSDIADVDFLDRYLSMRKK
jgi:hypothetical protein